MGRPAGNFWRGPWEFLGSKSDGKFPSDLSPGFIGEKLFRVFWIKFFMGWMFLKAFWFEHFVLEPTLVLVTSMFIHPKLQIRRKIRRKLSVGFAPQKAPGASPKFPRRSPQQCTPKSTLRQEFTNNPNNVPPNPPCAKNSLTMACFAQIIVSLASIL